MGVQQAGDVALLVDAAASAGIESSRALDTALLTVYEPRVVGTALSVPNPLLKPCPDAEAATLLGRIVAEQAFALTLAVKIIAESRGISVAEAVQLLNTTVEA